MSPWRVKMPTQNLLMLQLLLVRIVLATICCRFWSWCLVKKLLFRLEHKVSSRFWSWSSGKIGSWSLAIFLRWYFVEVMKLNLGRDFEARFVKILLSFMERLMFRWNFEVDAWSRFWRCNLIKIFVWTCDMNSTLGSVVPLAMFKWCALFLLSKKIWPSSISCEVCTSSFSMTYVRVAYCLCICICVCLLYPVYVFLFSDVMHI